MGILKLDPAQKMFGSSPRVSVPLGIEDGNLLGLNYIKAFLVRCSQDSFSAVCGSLAPPWLAEKFYSKICLASLNAQIGTYQTEKCEGRLTAAIPFANYRTVACFPAERFPVWEQALKECDRNGIFLSYGNCQPDPSSFSIGYKGRNGTFSIKKSSQPCSQGWFHGRRVTCLPQ